MSRGVAAEPSLLAPGSALDEALDAFLDRAASIADSHPWLVVIAMHEYLRCLYPADPHLPFAQPDEPCERVRRVLDSCHRFLEKESISPPTSSTART